jgi:hypothetical protein
MAVLVMDGYTAGEDRWMAIYRGESIWDPEPEPEEDEMPEREEPVAEIESQPAPTAEEVAATVARRAA